MQKETSERDVALDQPELGSQLTSYDAVWALASLARAIPAVRPVSEHHTPGVHRNDRTRRCATRVRRHFHCAEPFSGACAYSLPQIHRA